MKKYFMILLAVLLLTGLSMDAFAKSSGGGFSGGGRSGGFSSGGGSRSGGFSSGGGSKSSGGGSKSSSGGFSSGSKSSTPAPKASTPSSTSSSKPSAISGSRSSSKTSSSSKADVAAYKAAQSSGKAFKTPDAAKTNFKTNIDKECPTKFSAEPPIRPSYIPPNHNYNGTQVPVSYNRDAGGYGFFDPMTKAFIMFSVIDMMNDNDHQRIMKEKGYYVGEEPKEEEGCGAGGMVLAFVIVVIIAGVGFIIWKESQ